jgi:hypothetical protein
MNAVTMTTSSEKLNEVYRLLDENLPMIHALLVNFYGFNESEAEAFNDTLAVWLHRLARRSEHEISFADLRDTLVFVACKYARAFQVARGFAGRHFDARLEESIARPSEEVALALLSHVPVRASS